MKVLRMPLCQQDTRPRTKPGRKMVANVGAITCNCFSGGIIWPNEENSANPFPRRERRQAAKKSRNLQTTGRSKILIRIEQLMAI